MRARTSSKENDASADTTAIVKSHSRVCTFEIWGIWDSQRCNVLQRVAACVAVEQSADATEIVTLHSRVCVFEKFKSTETIASESIIRDTQITAIVKSHSRVCIFEKFERFSRVSTAVCCSVMQCVAVEQSADTTAILTSHSRVCIFATFKSTEIIASESIT